MITVEAIIKEWLSANGYAGLCNPDSDCGCSIEDFAPCCSSMQDCYPAYELECPKHGSFYGTTKDCKCYYCSEEG